MLRMFICRPCVAKGFAGGAMELRICFPGGYFTDAPFHNKAAKVRIHDTPFAALRLILIRFNIKKHT